MNDIELADAVVALGVVKRYPDEREWWCYFSDEVGQHTTKTLVRDWRVAGSLMERCFELNTTRTHAFNPYWPVQSAMSEHQFGGESLPRAIIEACVKALNGEQAVSDE